MATAATGLATFAPSPASSAAPPAGKQAAGWYRYKVGTIEVTVVTDGARAFPLSDTFVRNVPKADVNKGLEAGYMAKDNVWVPYTPIAVNTGAKLVVDRHRARPGPVRAKQGRGRPVSSATSPPPASTATRSTP